MTAAVLAAGLIAFRQVRRREEEREREGNLCLYVRLPALCTNNFAFTHLSPFFSLSPFPQGNTKVSQAMMRARVGAQAATVALMLGSTGAYAWGGGKDGGTREGSG